MKIKHNIGRRVHAQKEIVHASFDFGYAIGYHCEFYANRKDLKECRVGAWNTLVERFPELKDKRPIKVEIYYLDGPNEVFIFPPPLGDSL